MAPQPRPIRVLHLVSSLNVGGIETWLMRLLRHADRHELAMDIAAYRTTGPLVDEARRLGAPVFACPRPDRPWRFTANLRRLLQQHGPYHAVHAHLRHRCGLALRTAHHLGVPCRIAHSHNDHRAVDAVAPWWWQCYRGLMQRWIRQHATLGLACSNQAGLALFGDNWGRDTHHVMPYGIELEPFEQPVDASAVRRGLGIPPGAPVLGHVGRFAEQKNHRFLIDVMAQVHRRLPDARLLLCGDGELRPEIEQRVRQQGLEDRVIFTGVRNDLSRLMMGAMDCFVLPSHYEGLGVVAIEARAAGLPLILADSIPREIEAVGGIIQRRSLRDSASRWAQTITEICQQRQTTSRVPDLTRLRESSFDINNNVSTVMKFYQTGIQNRHGGGEKPPAVPL